MKKAALALLLAAMPAAAQTTTVFNPFTGKPDYVGGGSVSTNTINTSPQYRAAYYSATGSSSTLSGFDGLTVDPTAGVAISTITSSTGTIREFHTVRQTVHGTGAGSIALREGLSTTVQRVGSGAFVMWADSVTHWGAFNPGNASSYTFVGAPISSSAPTVGHIPLWAGQSSILDSGIRIGDIGYHIEPATVTILADLGIKTSTLTATSTTTFPYVTRTDFTNVSTISLSSAFLDVSLSSTAMGPTNLSGSYGTSGQVYTSGGVGGALPTWTTPSSGGSGTPGGSAGQLQWNSASSFAGAAGSIVTASSISYTGTIQASTISINTGGTTPNAPLKIGAGGLRGSNPGADIARTVGIQGGHGWQDSSVINGDATTGYNPFANFTVMNGVGPYEHHVGFQSAESYSSTSTISYLYDFLSQASYDNTGNSSLHVGFRAANPTLNSSGRPGTMIGFYVPAEMTAGSSDNWGTYFFGHKNFAQGMMFGTQDSYYANDNTAEVQISANKTDANLRLWQKDLNEWDVTATSGTANFGIKDANTIDYLTILGNGGNVGISTGNPTYKMDVNGGLLVRSSATVQGGSGLNVTYGVTAGTGTFTSVAVSSVMLNGVALLPQSVNVLAYGAVCDGSTDSSAAIQSAINAVAAIGGAVYFPKCASTYNIGSTTLTITTDGVSLFGDSATGSRIKYTGANSAIAIGVQTTGTFKKFNRVQNLGIDLTGASAGATGITLFQTWWSTLENLYINSTLGGAPNGMTCMRLDGGRTGSGSDFGTYLNIINPACVGDFTYGIRNVPSDSTYVNAFTAVTVTGGTISNTSTGYGTTFNISSCTNTSPIVVKTATAHGYRINDRIPVVVSGVVGTTAANDTWIAEIVTTDTFKLLYSVGNGAYTPDAGDTVKAYNVGFQVEYGGELEVHNTDTTGWTLGTAINANYTGCHDQRNEVNTLDFYISPASDMTCVFGRINTMINHGTNTTMLDRFGGFTKINHALMSNGLMVSGDGSGNSASIQFQSTPTGVSVGTLTYTSGNLAWNGSGGLSSTYNATVGTITVNSGVAFTQTYKAAVCQSGTASLGFSAFSTSAPVVSCAISTSTVMGLASFVDNSTMSVQDHFSLPSDWTGAVNANIVWTSTMTTNDVVWKIRTGCAADAEQPTVTWNAFSSVTDTTKAIASQMNQATISSISTTNCSAGEEMFFELVRDPANAADTLASTANLVTLQLVLRRTLTL